ncbi:hypothetical protein BHE74_00040834 [Ensete ventricosum]|nr:hypothetical protein BHE74_00040834 [Ensete ventricosum]
MMRRRFARSPAGRRGGASSLRRETRHRLVASFLRGETHGIAGSGLSTYRYPIGLAARMSTPARKRLMRDFKRLQQDPPAGISGAPHDNNIMFWNAVIFGYVQKDPDDTPWDGGRHNAIVSA